jgi:DnaJ-class molecular chaperone
MPATTYPSRGDKGVCSSCQGTGTLVRALAPANRALRLPARSSVSRCAACKGTGRRS